MNAFELGSRKRCGLPGAELPVASHTVETCISFMGLYLIRMVRSVETKTDKRDRTNEKIGRSQTI